MLLHTFFDVVAAILCSFAIVRSIACLKLEEYQTAKTAFLAGAALAPEDSRFKNFIKECDERIAGI